MPIRAQINPSTVKASYNAVTKKQIAWDTYCGHCGETDTPMTIRLTLSGITGGACQGPYPWSYSAHPSNINAAWGLDIKKDVACGWFHEEDGDFGYTRYYASSGNCTGDYEDRYWTHIVLEVARTAFGVTVRVDLTGDAVCVGDVFSVDAEAPEEGYCTKITNIAADLNGCGVIGGQATIIELTY